MHSIPENSTTLSYNRYVQAMSMNPHTWLKINPSQDALVVKVVKVFLTVLVSLSIIPALVAIYNLSQLQNSPTQQNRPSSREGGCSGYADKNVQQDEPPPEAQESTGLGQVSNLAQTRVEKPRPNNLSFKSVNDMQDFFRLSERQRDRIMKALTIEELHTLLLHHEYFPVSLMTEDQAQKVAALPEFSLLHFNERIRDYFVSYHFKQMKTEIVQLILHNLSLNTLKTIRGEIPPDLDVSSLSEEQLEAMFDTWFNPNWTPKQFQSILGKLSLLGLKKLDPKQLKELDLTVLEENKIRQIFQMGDKTPQVIRSLSDTQLQALLPKLNSEVLIYIEDRQLRRNFTPPGEMYRITQFADSNSSEEHSEEHPYFELDLSGLSENSVQTLLSTKNYGLFLNNLSIAQIQDILPKLTQSMLGWLPKWCIGSLSYSGLSVEQFVSIFGLIRSWGCVEVRHGYFDCVPWEEIQPFLEKLPDWMFEQRLITDNQLAKASLTDRKYVNRKRQKPPFETPEIQRLKKELRECGFPVDQCGDHEDYRREYRQYLLAKHPDKNSSPSAAAETKQFFNLFEELMRLLGFKRPDLTS